MATKYIKKNGKIIAVEWTEDKTSNYLIGGVVIAILLATGFAYFKYVKGE